MSKYKNIKCEYKGMKFDSRKEMNRYIELEYLQREGQIEDLVRQHKIDLRINSKHGFYLIVDFVYIKNGKIIYEDVKAFDKKTSKYLTTPVFNLKKKLISLQYGIDISLF